MTLCPPPTPTTCTCTGFWPRLSDSPQSPSSPLLSPLHDLLFSTSYFLSFALLYTLPSPRSPLISPFLDSRGRAYCTDSAPKTLRKKICLTHVIKSNASHFASADSPRHQTTRRRGIDIISYHINLLLITVGPSCDFNFIYLPAAQTPEGHAVPLGPKLVSNEL